MMIEIKPQSAVHTPDGNMQIFKFLHSGRVVGKYTAYDKIESQGLEKAKAVAKNMTSFPGRPLSEYIGDY